MDKLLTISVGPKDERPVSLAISSAPSTSRDAVLYDDALVGRLRAWMVDGDTDAGFMSAPCGSGATTLIRLLMSETGVAYHEVDHTAKDFQKMLDDSNKIHCDIVVVDGVDSDNGKRIVGIMKDHRKTSAHKMLCIGHRSRKSTSNAFAARWKHFHFDAPKTTVMMTALTSIVAGRVSDDDVRGIFRASPTDIRSCINSLEMNMIRPSGDSSSRDEFVDVIDAIERVFSRRLTFDELYNLYEHESGAIALGCHENYLRGVGNVRAISDITVSAKIARAVSDIAESISASDTMKMGDDFVMLPAFCACSAGFLNVCDYKNPMRVEKYGTVISKSAQRAVRKKKIDGQNLRRLKMGCQALPASDFGFNLGPGYRVGKLGR
jgi:hypothetical protein